MNFFVWDFVQNECKLDFYFYSIWIDGCENKNCEFYSVCESDGEGGKCICPQSCVHVSIISVRIDSFY
jgi:hypothetical protein